MGNKVYVLGLRLLAPGWIAVTNFGLENQADMIEGLLGIALHSGIADTQSSGS